MLARERWEVASAELLRIIRIDPTTQIEPVEPPHLRVTLVDLHQNIDELIPIGLTYRPELASRQAQVQATLVLLRQELLRPLVPSILLRGASTSPTGTLGYGVFGGGQNGRTADFGLEYRIMAPRSARLIVEHEAGDVNVEGVTGDIEAKVRQGQITLHLPEGAKYSLDAKAAYGNVNSDFPGEMHRDWIGQKALQREPNPAHRLKLRVGYGDIVLLRIRVPEYSGAAPGKPAEGTL